MEQITVKAKKWGNSIGIVIPRFIVEKEKIDEDEDVTITIHQRKAITAGELMELSKKLGLSKKIKRDTSQIMREVDETFE